MPASPEWNERVAMTASSPTMPLESPKPIFDASSASTVGWARA